MEQARTRAAYAITVLFELESGCFEEFHRMVSENAATSVRFEPGCFRFDVLTSIGTQGQPQIFLYELYADRAAFDLHLTSEHFRVFDEQSRPLVRQKTVAAFSLSENAKSDLSA